MTALADLVLTPDYFCSRIVKLCATPVYETISLEEDVGQILSNKPSDADHFIDRLYEEMALDTKPRDTITLV